MSEKRAIYVAVSQTGTILSRIIKCITHKEYNHASISLHPDLHTMYSFGRLHPYNPFVGGFVEESVSHGTFKRFKNARVVILKITVSEQEYSFLCNQLEFIARNRDRYGYNYLGLCLAAFKICFKAKHRYYCSEFVRDMLIKSQITSAEFYSGIVHPMNFFELPNCEAVFCGRLRDYKSI